MRSNEKNVSGSMAKCSQMSLAADRHDAVHEDGRHAQLVEGVHERLLHRGVVLGVLGGLATLDRVFVRGAQVAVAYAECVMELKGVHGLLEGEDGLLGCLDDAGVGGACGDAAAAVARLVALLLGHAVEAGARQAVKHAGEQRALLQDRVDDALVVACEQRRAVGVLAGLARVVGLGAERDGLLAEAERRKCARSCSAV